MVRPPLVRIDGQPAEGIAAPPSEPAAAPPPRRPPRDLALLARLRRAPALQLWLGGACVAVLGVILALGVGRDETRRSVLDRATADAGGPVIATLQLPGSDTRPVRQVCDDEGLPAELCARSAACAPPAPAAAPRSPRVVRLFLRAPEAGGCG
jgi:hypothetical protein